MIIPIFGNQSIGRIVRAGGLTTSPHSQWHAGFAVQKSVVKWEIQLWGEKEPWLTEWVFCKETDAEVEVLALSLSF